MNIRRWLILIVVLLTFSACSNFSRWLRQYTYPPEFRYIDRAELRSTMELLAYHVHRLDTQIHAAASQQSDQEAILTELRGMEMAAARLDRAGWPSNHPTIDMNLPKFRQDLRLAREAAEKMPPNYVLAHAVTGACVYCHAPR